MSPSTSVQIISLSITVLKPSLPLDSLESSIDTIIQFKTCVVVFEYTAHMSKLTVYENSISVKWWGSIFTQHHLACVNKFQMILDGLHLASFTSRTHEKYVFKLFESDQLLWHHNECCSNNQLWVKSLDLAQPYKLLQFLYSNMKLDHQPVLQCFHGAFVDRL